MAHGRLERVPLSRLVAGPWHRNIGKTDDLQQSFQFGAQQVLQNIVVRERDGKLEVLAGWRRVTAAKAMGWSHVDARVVDCDDRQAETIFWEENIRRKALTTPEQREAAQRLKALLEPFSKRGGDRRSKSFQVSKRQNDTLKSASAQIAVLTGKSRRTAQRLLSPVGTTTRDKKEVIADKLRQSLRLAVRCLDELGPLDPSLRAEAVELVQTLTAKLKTTGRLQAVRDVAARRGKE